MILRHFFVSPEAEKQPGKLLYVTSFVGLVGVLACSPAGASDAPEMSSGNSGNNGSSNDTSGESENGLPVFDDTPQDNPSSFEGPPQTCEQAAQARTYVGCEFWPTITANPVYVEFDPTVVMANGTDSSADVTVTGPDGFSETITIAAGGLGKVTLPWVMSLKGPEFSTSNTSGGRLKESMRQDDGAFHVTTSVPVTAWQFNPLQYKKVCPRILAEGECRSATNDASLLIPTTAMTGNYRIFAYSSKNEGDAWGTVPGGFSITATQDNTEVTVQLGPRCGVEIFPTTDLGTCVAAGPGIEAKSGNEIYDFSMNAGDVVQLVGAWSDAPQVRNADVSGSVINATAPVQVVSFNAISQLPDYSIANADHMEETVLPAEVLGNKYIVPPPTTPLGNAVGHVVRIYGNVDNTQLSYPEGKPEGAPDMINAGEVVQVPPLPQGQPAPDCLTTDNKCMISESFVVEGTESFAVASFMVGGVLQMPGTDATNSQGDPAFSMMVTPEQFRQNYTFLAPTDYEVNFAEILIPEGAEVLLDGQPLDVSLEAIGGSEWSLARAPLSDSTDGVHTISTTDERGVGLQVTGFGFATSYYYPGGLNLTQISEPPQVIR